MSDRTQFALGQRKFSMPRHLKRTLQVAIATVLTAAAALLIVMSNSLLVARGGFRGIDIWLAFINRADIIGTIVLTALVTVYFVYWQRDRERR